MTLYVLTIISQSADSLQRVKIKDNSHNTWRIFEWSHPANLHLPLWFRKIYPCFDGIAGISSEFIDR